MSQLSALAEEILKLSLEAKLRGMVERLRNSANARPQKGAYEKSLDNMADELEAALASEPARIQVTDEMVRVGAELHWFIETGHRNFSQLSEAAQGQRLDTMRAALEAALESISA